MTNRVCIDPKCDSTLKEKKVETITYADGSQDLLTSERCVVCGALLFSNQKQITKPFSTVNKRPIGGY